MLEYLLAFITEFIKPLGAFGVFLAEFLDGIFVFVPTTVIVLAASLIFLEGPMSLPFLKTLFGTVVIPSSNGLSNHNLFTCFFMF